MDDVIFWSFVYYIFIQGVSYEIMRVQYYSHGTIDWNLDKNENKTCLFIFQGN